MKKAHIKKQELIDELADKFSRSSLSIFTDYRGSEAGLTVEQISKLRRSIRESGGEFKVAKNTLLLRALNKIGAEGFDKVLQDPTAVVFAFEDAASTSKALVEFTKETQSKLNPAGVPTVKAGFMEGAVVNASQIIVLASLPSRNVLLATLLATMQAPISSFARVINAPLAGLVNVLDAIRKQKAEAAA